MIEGKMKYVGMLVLALEFLSVNSQDRAPVEPRQRESWMAMYGVPDINNQWQGPPFPRSEKENELGYTEHVLNESEVRARHSGIFDNQPTFHPSFKSPCFETEQGEFQCLPYGFIIGFPKCATSDLWERLQLHPQVANSNNKETRFLTQGEYANASPEQGWIGKHTRLSTFTHSFQQATQTIASQRLEKAVLLEGTPLTAWWSSQRPEDGLGRQGYDAPPPLFLHALLPSARLIAMVSNPVLRMYSDYWFVGPRSVIHTSRDIETAARSPHHFHGVASEQVNDFHRCLNRRAGGADVWKEISSAYSPQPQARTLWVRRAVGECVADRSAFALPGSGRLGVGVYVGHLNAWVGDGPWRREALLVLRREDFAHIDSRAPSLLRALRHLDLSLPSTRGDEALRRAWEVMVEELPPQNVWKRDRAPMLQETRELLSKFYSVFGEALTRFMSADCTNLDSSPAECEQANRDAVLLSYSSTSTEVVDSGGRKGEARDSIDYKHRKWSPHVSAHSQPPIHGCRGQEPMVPASAEMTALLINSGQASHDFLSLRVRLYTVLPFNGHSDRFTACVNFEYAVGWHHPYIVEGVEDVAVGKWLKMKECLSASDWCVFIPSSTAILDHSTDWVGEAVLEADRSSQHVQLLEGGIVALKSCADSMQLIDTVLSGVSETSLLEFTEESTSSLHRVKSAVTAAEATNLLRGLCKGETVLRSQLIEQAVSVTGEDSDLVWN